MQSKLEGKTALVTGATSNIGRAIAIALGAAGARVAVSGRDEQRGAEVVAAIAAARAAAGGGAADGAAGGGAVFLPADLDGSPAASEALAAAANAALGQVDILVNNAGIYPSTAGVAVDEALFDRMYAVNVKAPYFLTETIAPQMAARGDGAIINLGSWIVRLGVGSALYSSTKGAVETMTRAWAAEYGPRGVRVNAISPGVVQAEGHAGEVMMRGTPHGTMGRPEAIGDAAVYLAGADFVHGAVLDVDGGRTSVAVIAA
jgi:NAD(P)-dependent dehydrogenase (short-subunit alcohol dehydrogenase family)